MSGAWVARCTSLNGWTGWASGQGLTPDRRYASRFPSRVEAERFCAALSVGGIYRHSYEPEALEPDVEPAPRADLAVLLRERWHAGDEVAGRALERILELEGVLAVLTRASE